MDVFEAESKYEDVFVFKETPSVSDKFAFLGTEDMNFTMNSGSLYVMFLLIILEEYTRKFINFIASKFPTFTLARKIGARYYQTDQHYSRQAILRLFLEGYLDIAFCSLLQLLAFKSSANFEEFT